MTGPIDFETVAVCAEVHRDMIVLQQARDARRVPVMKSVRLVAPGGHVRSGALKVASVEPETGVVRFDADIRTAGDVLQVQRDQETDDDHAALVTYLLSAVRRCDWHAVSDAANDLRVLEAKRR